MTGFQHVYAGQASEASSVKDQQRRRGSLLLTTARKATASELNAARAERVRSETALQAALASLKTERQARAAAEQRAETLRKQLAARRASGGKISQGANGRPRSRAAVKSKARVPAKKAPVVTFTAGDIGFQP